HFPHMTESRPLMAGKRGLIMGLANDRSIAWGIAKALAAHGAELAITYQVEALGKRVRPLAEELKAGIIMLCDLMIPQQVDALFAEIPQRWGKLDFVVHAVAFSDKNELDGDYVATTRGNFLRTMDISVYSFTDLAQRALPLMTGGGGLLTMTYYGA